MAYAIVMFSARDGIGSKASLSKRAELSGCFLYKRRHSAQNSIGVPKK